MLIADNARRPELCCRLVKDALPDETSPLLTNSQYISPILSIHVPPFTETRLLEREVNCTPPADATTTSAVDLHSAWDVLGFGVEGDFFLGGFEIVVPAHLRDQEVFRSEK
jgi:hypothetical protein